MSKAILFDLDGTLLDTLGDLRDAVNYAMDCWGYPRRTTEEVRRFLGNGAAALVACSLPENVEETSRSRALNTFRSYYSTHSQELTRPYPGIRELLAALREKKIPMAVISNKMDPAVKPLCEHYFPGTFPVAVGERPGVAKKPAPDGVIRAAEELGVSLADCIYVGDSEVDLETARNAGIPCLSVTWGFRDREFLREQGAKMLIGHPMELIPYLEEMI